MSEEGTVQYLEPGRPASQAHPKAGCLTWSRAGPLLGREVDHAQTPVLGQAVRWAVPGLSGSRGAAFGTAVPHARRVADPSLRGETS